MQEEYLNYTQAEFLEKLGSLIELSPYFKFTGGEPTLNPNLLSDLTAVKSLGGHSFLDSNGSYPNVISNILKSNLIDVLGISIKGLNKEEARRVSAVKDGKLCWDNVLKTIEIAEYYHIRVIVTMVFHQDIPIDSLYGFSKLMESYQSVHLKINNLLPVDYQGDGIFLKQSEVALESAVKNFVEKNPKWKNRVTLVNSERAKSEYSSVIFL